MFNEMREPKPNETVKKRRSCIEYFDELGRNTYYYNKNTYKWYEKSWTRLSNGLDVETYVEGQSYWRKHFYDIHRCVLISEIDSEGKKDLRFYRQLWNPKDIALSEELMKNQKTDGSIELF